MHHHAEPQTRGSNASGGRLFARSVRLARLTPSGACIQISPHSAPLGPGEWPLALSLSLGPLGASTPPASGRSARLQFIRQLEWTRRNWSTGPAGAIRLIARANGHDFGPRFCSPLLFLSLLLLAALLCSLPLAAVQLSPTRPASGSPAAILGRSSSRRRRLQTSGRRRDPVALFTSARQWPPFEPNQKLQMIAPE